MAATTLAEDVGLDNVIAAARELGIDAPPAIAVFDGQDALDGLVTAHIAANWANPLRLCVACVIRFTGCAP
ncbi:hypothetical protein DB728_09340 [Rhizobium leguminosarum bv. viciae USDA 2370]|nr:hypothetical protein DB728_09340 [Rhizobium leguminosarum bv. viciae USDA 2370]TBZ50636.1 hypothetical protein E0H42_20495 [Rhizobium leguminosarum bv. viciae]TBZ72449.1 hypothetical protein E0H43_17075 [Rhizobium leguminosarum bv. viciae]TBZ80573.1 hypothetical protein E0H53_29600 [Rhizobium leguminosarum bv. viciae]TBZ99518.1 hypothetical protein E0H63_25405 [Rhizobium leguminosarum bv. viciae]